MNDLIIHSSTDWEKVSVQLKKMIYSVPYNSDLHKLYRNISLMITELSKTEVYSRQTGKYHYVNESLTSINNTIKYVVKLTLYEKLKQ